MGINSRNITLIVLILVVLIKRCHSQVTCPVPCDLGYTCYNTRTRHGTTEPGCIPMLEYLRRIQGTNHVNTRQDNVPSNRVERFRPEINGNQFSSFRQNDPFGQDRPLMDRSFRSFGTSTFSNFQDERQSNIDVPQPFRQGNQGERQVNIDVPQPFRQGNQGDRQVNIDVPQPFRQGNQGERQVNIDVSQSSHRNGNTFSRDSTRTLGIPSRISNMRNRQMQDRTQSRIIVDPITGQRFALIPLDNRNWQSAGLRGSSSTGLNSLDSENTFANNQNSLAIEQRPIVNKFSGQSTRNITPIRRRADTSQQVPTANRFEQQLPDTSSPQQAPASGRPTQSPSPVGPLTNNRDKNIAEMIEELVMQVNSRQRHITTTVPGVVLSSDVQSKKEVNQGINVETTTSIPVTFSWVGSVTEHSFQHETITLPESSVESVGRVSSFLKDDTGYYFLFYPQIGKLEGLRVNVTKTGFCPSIPPSLQSRQCNNWCTSDIQCPDDLKCCPNGCSLLCTPPGGRGQ